MLPSFQEVQIVSERGFRFLEHTADVLVEAWGPSLEAVFEEMARGMFEIMTDTSKVEPREHKEIEVCGFDLENLLYRWLEELLYLHDSENYVFSRFKVNRIEKRGGSEEEEYCLHAEVWGEKFDRERHEPRTVVKAVTYAQMRIEKQDSVWRAQTVFDI